MKSIHTNYSSRYLYYCTYFSMICFYRFHWSRVLDCLSYDFVILIALNRRAFDIIVWLHLRCFIATNSNRIYHITIIYIMHHHRMLRSINEDNCRAFSTKVLFYFFVYTSLFDDLLVFEHYNRYLRSTSQSRFYINNVSHKFF